jgi:hypothetical protein
MFEAIWRKIMFEPEKVERFDLAEGFMDKSPDGYYVEWSEYEELREVYEKFKEALTYIAGIKNQLTGGDWDEIETARGCAKTALDRIGVEL